MMDPTTIVWVCLALIAALLLRAARQLAPYLGWWAVGPMWAVCAASLAMLAWIVSLPL